jgi:hypothetical protein
MLPTRRTTAIVRIVKTLRFIVFSPGIRFDKEAGAQEWPPASRPDNDRTLLNGRGNYYLIENTWVT